MSIFYRTESITAEDLISMHPFELPGDGRRLQFCVDGPAARNTLIYTVIDGEAKRFENGGPLSTPIRGPERVIRYRPHTAFALAVRMSREHLRQAAELPPIFISCASGETIQLRLHAEIGADVSVRDPDRLVNDYLDGCITDAWQEVSQALVEMLKKAIAATVADSLRGQGGETADAVLDAAAAEAEAETTRRMCCLYPWMGFACTITMTAENVEELLAAVNRPFTIRMELARRMFDAALEAYGRTPLPAEISQVLVAYVQSNPGATEEQLTRLLKNSKAIYERTSPEKFLNAAAALYPAMKGSGIRYVLS